MYSVGEEFEKMIDDDVEYFTCIANVNIGDKEYLICENETGVKRVFGYDQIEEELEILEDDEADEVLEVWEEEYYGTDKEYMYWNEEFGEYDNSKNERENFDDLDDFNSMDDDIYDDDDFEDIDEIYDEDELNDFLDDFLEE